jgi:hypothetical protein
MSAYADLSYDEFEQSGGRNNARMRQVFAPRCDRPTLCIHIIFVALSNDILHYLVLAKSKLVKTTE